MRWWHLMEPWIVCAQETHRRSCDAEVLRRWSTRRGWRLTPRLYDRDHADIAQVASEESAHYHADWTHRCHHLMRLKRECLHFRYFSALLLKHSNGIIPLKETQNSTLTITIQPPIHILHLKIGLMQIFIKRIDVVPTQL